MGSVVALDVGGTDVKYAVVDASGALSREGSFPTRAHEGGEALVRRMAERVNELRAQDASIRGVAVSTAGQVLLDHATVSFASNIPGLSGLNLGEALRKATDLPCHVENDVNAAALGEQWLGAARGARALIMLTLGTGVGGAAIMDDRLFTGARGSAGEFGHMTLYPGGDPCPCGQVGCFERYASAGALERATHALPAAHPARGDLRALFDACRAGDADALCVLERWVDDLAMGLTNLVHGFNPDVILLGGGVSAQGAYLSERVYARLAARALPSFMEGVRVETAALHNSAGLLGAARALFEKERMQS